MISKIILKSGSAIDKPKLEIELTPITIFVGPNNSGKSKILREIEENSINGNFLSNNLLLDFIEFIPYSEAEFEMEIDKIKQSPHDHENLTSDYVIIGKLNSKSNQNMRYHSRKDTLFREARNPNDSRWEYQNFLKLYTLRLDGTNRLNLLQDQNAGDLLKNPQNTLSQLFLNNSLRIEVRRIVLEAFGKYYVIDPTNIGQLRVRLADHPPASERQEKGWDEDAVEYHKKALLISETSDGVKAFTGIITTLLAGDPKITLIDEPEAFLHPALSNKLGKEIGRSLHNSSKRFFASTHSSSFLMGCIQSGAPLNIVRLTYKNGVATSRLLPKDRILSLMRNPLLRSTGVLNGLFYESVIVTEADSDRAFYQEINERLLSAGDPRGIENCLFINAQNKQTVWDIVKPLRELGIPTVGIVDIDVIKEGGQVFTKLMEGAYIPQLSHQSLNGQRAVIKGALELTNKKWKIEGGIDLLAHNDKEAASDFFNHLDEYGVFVVRQGEVEAWLKHTGATGHGPNWLIDVFSKIGENPLDETYLKPDSNDIWEFLGVVKGWIENPTKKGIPS